MCRSYFPYSDEIQKLNFKYDFCPTECVKSGAAVFDTKRNDFCGECPKKRLKDGFRKKYEAAIESAVSNGRNYPFDELLDLLHIIRLLEDAPKEKLTVRDAGFLSVYLQSKNTFEKEKNGK